jgi:hypothetical protein
MGMGLVGSEDKGETMVRNAIVYLVMGCGVVRGVEVVSTSTPFAGITRYDVTDTSPRVIHYELVQIDTTAAGISFNLTPSNGATAGETNAATTLNYMKGLPAVGSATAAMGINAGYFTPVGSATPSLISMEVSAGQDVSAWPGDGDTRASGINISSTNVVSFFTPGNYTLANYATNPSVTLYNAVGSNYMSVRNGVKTGVVDDGAANARTAVGVKGKYLYFFTVDEVGGSGSAGLTPVEVGTLLHDSWGLTDVINFDGGGSTQMVQESARGGTYIDTPEGGASPRAVAASMVVYANAAPAGTVNVLDNFEGGQGHFVSSIYNASGSNRNIGSTSVETVVASEHHTGSDAMKLSVMPTAGGWLDRDLSAAAVVAQNVVMTTGGSIGYWLKTTTAGVTTAPAIHDGSALESGAYQTLIADGQWHLYQWSFTDANQWNSFSGGNGQIDNVGVTLDSILFQGTGSLVATIYLDDLDWTNAGAIPEPSGVGIGLLFVGWMGRRRGCTG